MAENPSVWPQVRETFEALLDQPAEVRAKHLAELSRRSPAVAAEVVKMLGWSARSEGFLEPEDEALPEPLPPELTLYRLGELLGRGGMGSVYRAERADGLYKKPVAVKVLDWSPENRELNARFRAERQILAALDHKNIAQLLDGGATRDGRPYFVLELVEGEPLDRFCDGHRLPIRARLELFLKVAAAVSFAHRHLVVHRDLKPANVLVGADGEPKLLDFGIAKLMTPEAFDLTLLPTEHGLAPLTPDYASPEQVSSQPVSVASDVYTLGVLLYRLLSGRKPYSLTGLRFDQVVATICEKVPERMSTAVLREAEGEASAEELAARRGADPKGLARRLEGDLDTIVAKAMAKERARRYASVEELSADLTAHLAGHPVRARPDTFRYRAGKFLLRHRLGASAAAIALVTLLGLLAALWQQRLDLLDRQRQLIRERNRAEAVSGFLSQVFASPDPALARGRVVTAKELLDKGVAEIGAELADQPGPRADLLLTMGRSYKSLGRYEEAKPLLEQALALLLADDEAGPGRLADSYHELAEVASFSGRLEDAERDERRALAERRRSGQEGDALITGLSRLGKILNLAGRYEEAAVTFEEAIAHGRARGPSAALAAALQRFADVERRRDRPRAAEALLREALALQAQVLGETHPEHAVTANDLGLVLLEQGRLDEAEVVFTATEEELRTLYAAGHPQLAATLLNLARLRGEQNRPREAEALLREAVELARAAYPGDHPLVATSLARLGAHLARQGLTRDAEAVYRDAVEQIRRALPTPHPEVAALVNDLGLFLLEQGRGNEARPLFEDALEQVKATLGPEHSQVAVILNNQGYLAHNQGDLETAGRHYREALAVVRAAREPRPQELALALHNLGSLERDQNDLAAAEKSFREALAVLTGSLGEEHANTAMARLSLADVLATRGDAEAAAMAERSLVTLRQAFSPSSPWVAAAERILGRARQGGRSEPKPLG